MRLCHTHQVRMVVVRRKCHGRIINRTQCNECIAAWHRAKRARRIGDAFRKLATMPRPAV